MTNEARHESPVKTAFGFGTAVFTGVGTADIAPGSEDITLVSYSSILFTYLCHCGVFITIEKLLRIMYNITLRPERAVQ